jgi:hypothetical protein
MRINRRCHEPDDEAPLLDHQRPAHHGAHFLDARQHLNGLFVKKPPGLGESKWPRRTIDQFSANLRLELLDLPAQRRLGDAEPIGRAGEIAFIYKRYKVAKLSKVHALSYLMGITSRPE